MSPIATLPRLVVELDGSPLGIEQSAALRTVTVRQALSLPAQCEIAFGDLVPDVDIAPGARLRVLARDQQPALFTGEVTAVERRFGAAGQREVRARAYDPLHRLRTRQSVKVRAQVDAAGLAAELAGEVGLGLQSDERGPRWERLFQHRHTDLELLQDVCQRCGLWFAVRDSTLHLFTLNGIGDPVTLTLGIDLLEARIEANVDQACASVSVDAWDPLAAEDHDAEADSPRTITHPSDAGSDAVRHLPGEVVPGADHVRPLAQAELDWRAAGAVVFRGAAEGDPRLRPGARVRLAGLGPRLDGEVVLTEVVHTVDERRGYLCELSSQPPARFDRRRDVTVALGLVQRVDDPDNLGRVKVSLPAHGDAETEWLEVVTAGAGSGKGVVAVPDVGDRVLVLLADDDPAVSVVLGGLYGGEGAPDSGVVDGAVRRYTFLTPGGQRLTLDDERGAVRLEAVDGSFVELSPELARLHAVTDLEVDAPGRRLVLRADTVDFERA